MRLVTALTLVMAVLLPACAPLYAPPAVHVPMLEGQGQVQVGGYFGTNGVDGQAAVALLDHVGVMASTSVYRLDDEQEVRASTGSYHRHTMSAVGLGYFGRVSEHLHAEIYGGYGRGRAEGYNRYELLLAEGYGSEHDEAHFHRYFLQGSIIGYASRDFSVAVTLRVAWMDFYEITSSEPGADIRQGFFMEPVLTGHVDLGPFQLVTQAGFSFPSQDAAGRGFDYRPLIISAGLRLEFNVLR